MIFSSNDNLRPDIFLNFSPPHHDLGKVRDALESILRLLQAMTPYRGWDRERFSREHRTSECFSEDFDDSIAGAMEGCRDALFVIRSYWDLGD